MTAGSVLCVSVSPGLRGAYRPLGRALQPWVASIQRWDYQQTLDEPADLYAAVDLLVAYLRTQKQPFHLLGHGLSGVVAWLAAQACPDRIGSLVLLAVSPQAVTWHSHYYVQRRFCVDSREQILLRLSRSLFGDPHPFCWRHLVQGLAMDLQYAPCPYSIWHAVGHLPTLETLGIPVFVGGSWDDPVVDVAQLQRWHLKPQDVLWLAPWGRHFFHVGQAEALAQQLRQFWARVSPALEQTQVIEVLH
ncbi:MAG: alpha/beta hydrolase [Thermostichales cyanobacterium BF4_bins_65]